MVYGTEKPTTTRRGRIIIMAILWVVIGIPLIIGLWFLMGWWVLLLVVPAVWATLRHVRRDDRKRSGHRHDDYGQRGVPRSDFGMGSRAEEALPEDTDPPPTAGFM